MSSVTLNRILDRVFRSNPAYKLISFDRLPVEQQELLKDLKKDPDFYGVLGDPRREELPVKSICRNSALLIQSMMQPGQLPLHLRTSSDKKSNQAIAALVLDGILEIGDGESFFSGANACPILYSGEAAAEAEGFLPRLSQEALEYAQELSILDPADLSMRLYNYNRIPLTPQWTRRLPSEMSVLDLFGVTGTQSIKRELSHWGLVENGRPAKAWFEWMSLRHLSTEKTQQLQPHRAGYKLYVSPRPERLATAFPAVLEAIAESNAHAFKVGRNAANLLRPDKLVIYFRDFASLEQTAAVLAQKLAGCEAQGVPFTAAIGKDGLLSWGVDPVPEKGTLSWQGPESWRLWVTNRLATSMVSALRQRPETIEPWRFALERLRLEEIDVESWTPTAAFGKAA